MLATNAYTGVHRHGARTSPGEVVPVLSWQMATAPLATTCAAG